MEAWRVGRGQPPAAATSALTGVAFSWESLLNGTSQRQPDAEPERRHTIAKELTIRRGPRIRLEQHAPAPSGLRASARVAQLEPGDRAPPHVPAPVFEGLGVHGRHQATGGEPADSYKHPRRSGFQAAVPHAGLEGGRGVWGGVLNAAVDPPIR